MSTLRDQLHAELDVLLDRQERLYTGCGRSPHDVPIVERRRALTGAVCALRDPRRPLRSLLVTLAVDALAWVLVMDEAMEARVGAGEDVAA
jgi:hypothetical protein